MTIAGPVCGTAQLPGGLTLDQGRPGVAGCQDELVHGSGLAIVAAAIRTDGAVSAATCTLADTAARAAAAALRPAGRHTGSTRLTRSVRSMPAPY